MLIALSKRKEEEKRHYTVESTVVLLWEQAINFKATNRKTVFNLNLFFDFFAKVTCYHLTNTQIFQGK